MGYFPFFADIKNKRCVVVGGGNVALRKVEKLLPFEPEIVVVAPAVCSELKNISGIEITERNFLDSDIDNAFMVISATDNAELNAHIFSLCSEKKIPVNTVDDLEKCGFIFPALVHKNDITVGITTSGKSPIYARFLREQTEEMLSERSLEIMEIMGRFRPVIKQKFDTEEKRKNAAEALLKLCLTNDELPSDDTINALLEELKEHEN